MHWRLLSLLVTGILLTLELCRGRSIEDEDYFEATTADYDYENTTFEYYFFSNGSGTINYDMYEVLHEKKTDSDQVNKVRSTSDISKASGISLSAPIVLALSIQRLFYPL